MAKTVTIIDYGAGNLHSVAKSLQSVAGNDYKITVTNKPEQSDYLVLPGVGAFKACIDGIKAQPQAYEYIHEHITNQQKPFLGICVGMQLLADYGLENGKHEGLGLIKGEVKKFELDSSYTVPHMGWNNVELPSSSRLSALNGKDFYFVHSYYFDSADNNCILGSTNYGGRFTASIEKDNIMAVQFHPEKSQENGLEVLRTFLEQ